MEPNVELAYWLLALLSIFHSVYIVFGDER